MKAFFGLIRVVLFSIPALVVLYCGTVLLIWAMGRQRAREVFRELGPQ